MTAPKEYAKELIEKYCQILFGNEQFVNISKPIQLALANVESRIDDTTEWLVYSLKINEPNWYYEFSQKRIWLEEVKYELEHK